MWDDFVFKDGETLGLKLAINELTELPELPDSSFLIAELKKKLELMRWNVIKERDAAQTAANRLEQTLAASEIVVDAVEEEEVDMNDEEEVNANIPTEAQFLAGWAN